MYTVLGNGFIGRRLAATLRQQNEEVYVPPRDNGALFDRPLGDVVYAVGVTADFRSRPFATVEAHVCLLRQVLEAADFSSLLYLSSTRLYRRAGSSPADEDQRFDVDPADADDLYDLSKLTGEALCHAAGRESIRIARLSNVYGSGDRSESFVSTVLRQAMQGRVMLRTALESAKDYICVDDVVRLLPDIARRGQARVYNVASGRNVSHRQLLAAVAAIMPLTVEVETGAPAVVFPTISTARAQQELGFAPRRELLDDLPELIAELAEPLADD